MKHMIKSAAALALVILIFLSACASDNELYEAEEINLDEFNPMPPSDLKIHETEKAVDPLYEIVRYVMRKIA